MSDRGLYPYYKETAAPTFPGEMPYPEPVGFADPGISDLKANADHSHAPATDSGTIVQERLSSHYGIWGSGILTGSWVLIGSMSLIGLGKRFGGTNLRVQWGGSCFAITTGQIAIAVSPTNSSGDLAQVAQFYFNTTGEHHHFSGIIELPNRGAADYNVTFWMAGNMNMNTDGFDMAYATVSEVWP